SPSPIPLKERGSIVFVEKGQLDVLDGAFVLVDANGVRTVIPVGGLAVIMVEPGTRTSHAAVRLAASAGTLLIWTGEAGVRLSAATSCLYGITEAAVLAAGYAPAVGFLHTGKPLSFVYDIADLFKFDTVVPEAFRVAGMHAKNKLDRPPEVATRHACLPSND